MTTDEKNAEALLESIRRNVKSGRVQQLVMTPPMEWGTEDQRFIKAVLCMVASRMLLGKL